MKKYTARKMRAGEYIYRDFNIFTHNSYGWIAGSQSLDDFDFVGTFKTKREAKAWVDEIWETEYFLNALKDRREAITKYHLEEGDSL